MFVAVESQLQKKPLREAISETAAWLCAHTGPERFPSPAYPLPFKLSKLLVGELLILTDTRLPRSRPQQAREQGENIEAEAAPLAATETLDG